MSKPLGARFDISSGVPHIIVTRASQAEDAIWDAVREAINEGWNARKFRLEAATAWEELLRNDAKSAVQELEN